MPTFFPFSLLMLTGAFSQKSLENMLIIYYYNIFTDGDCLVNKSVGEWQQMAFAF
jgi:hypothetical protein